MPKSPKTAKKKSVITVAKYESHEMGFILVDGNSVFTGNYWDFHSGCHGTKIAGYDLSGIWDSGMTSLAGALKSKMEAAGKSVEIETKKLTKEEYKALGFYP